MSWKATSWAKETKGHRSHAQKLVLFTLADYFDDERGLAWPSQRRLSDDNEMPIRTVQRCLQRLAEDGFITVAQKGNQYQPTHYRFNFDIMAGAQVQAPAKSAPAIMSPALQPPSEPATSDKVNPPPATSELATAKRSNPQEPPVEPPVTATAGFYAALMEYGGLEKTEAHLVAWLEDRGISMNYAEETALSMRASLVYNEPKDRYERRRADGRLQTYKGTPVSIFQSWVKRPRPTTNGRYSGRADRADARDNPADFAGAWDG